MVADHFMPAKDAKSATLQKRLKDWPDAQGVFYHGQGRGGIEHTALVEDAWVAQELRIDLSTLSPLRVAPPSSARSRTGNGSPGAGRMPTPGLRAFATRPPWGTS